MIVYFSSRSENTHRFVGRLGLPAVRIPNGRDDAFAINQPFVLIVPTYAGDGGVASGNSNFGETYGLAGKIISKKCGVPFLYRFELLGTDEDVAKVKQGLEQFWTL
jgi:protein involved in ribonucleotide reduction